MPTYEYECQKCAHHFERFQKMSDEPVRSCPKCAGKVTRLIGSGSGIIFKGSGFYQTDYKNPASKKSRKRKSEGGSVCPGAKQEGCKGCSMSQDDD